MSTDRTPQNLLYLRKRFSFSVADLSAILNEDPSVIREWETGATELPANKRDELCKLYKVSKAELMLLDLPNLNLLRDTEVGKTRRQIENKRQREKIK